MWYEKKLNYDSIVAAVVLGGMSLSMFNNSHMVLNGI